MYSRRKTKLKSRTKMKTNTKKMEENKNEEEQTKVRRNIITTNYTTRLPVADKPSLLPIEARGDIP